MISLLRPVRQWWTQSDAQALHKAQDALLKTMVRAPFARLPTVAGVHGVEFSAAATTTTSRAQQDDSSSHPRQSQHRRPRHTVVLAHGFGSGLGFFYNNIDLLLSTGSVHRVLAVDWLGMGGSDRPRCRSAPIRFQSNCSWCDSDFTTPTQAVDFFIDPFHEWMEQQFTSNQQDEEALVTLVGHSLGGYLAARYIWKYHPSYVRRLVLASPVGFPPRPLNSLEGAQLPTSLRIVDALWSRNWTPQQLVRAVGAQRGRRSVQRALRARLPHLPTASADVLAEYLYHITVAEPSGEFAMNSLLEPVAAPDVMGVFAREPLSSILTANAATGSGGGSVRAVGNATSLSSIKVLYGEHDWMRPNNNETTARETLLQMQQLNPGIEEAHVDIVPNAGHHLYLENPVNFVRHIVR